MMEYYEEVLPRQVEMYLLCLESEKNKYSLKRTKIFGYPKHNAFSFIMLRKFCKIHDIDVLTNLSGTYALAYTLAFATIFSKTKSIFYNHGTLNYKQLIKTLPAQFFLDRILFCSPDIVEGSRKILFLSSYKIFPLEIPIDTNFFRPLDKESSRKELSLDRNDKILLHVSRIHPLKGSVNLLKLIEKNPRKKFILIGELMDKRYKEKNHPNLLLIDKVSKEELLNYYNAADLFLFLSKREGYGLPPREAMSCGTPAIVSDITALRLIDKAIKVPEDVEFIQREIENFFKLTKLQRKRFSLESRRCIIEDFPRERIDKDHITCFLNFD